LVCDHCGATRRFVRPPLMVIAGAAGTGKSTLCQRLAGTIPGTVVIDADVLAEDLVAVVSPNHDYPAFWRSLMRLAHEIAQNGVAVAYVGVTLPEQLVANDDLFDYFDGVHILGLVCDETDLRQRIEARAGGYASAAHVERHLDINRRIGAACGLLDMTLVDASRPPHEIEHDVRTWIVRLASGPK
jgi:gluconate kinase